jgi:hypothetical protein
VIWKPKKKKRPRPDFGFGAIGKKKVPKQNPLVLLVKVRWRRGDAEIVYVYLRRISGFLFSFLQLSA